MLVSDSHYRFWNFTSEEMKIASEYPYRRGAKKYVRENSKTLAIRFGIYAPHAQKIEIVFAHSGVGTLNDAIGILDHLLEMGVNAVEFLPMSEYGGKTETWGYSTSLFFAIEFSGCGRDKFKVRERLPRSNPMSFRSY